MSINTADHILDQQQDVQDQHNWGLLLVLSVKLGRVSLLWQTLNIFYELKISGGASFGGNTPFFFFFFWYLLKSVYLLGMILRVVTAGLYLGSFLVPLQVPVREGIFNMSVVFVLPKCNFCSQNLFGKNEYMRHFKKFPFGI